MKITNTYSSFPDQVVPDEVKSSMDYGKQVAQAIEGDWFSGTRSGVENRFNTNYNNFRMRRLYARFNLNMDRDWETAISVRYLHAL